MKNKILIGVIAAIIVIIIVAVGFAMITDEKSKFIGTWEYSDGGTITFNNDNTVNIDNIGPLGDLELIGAFEYNIADNQVTFSSGSISVTLNYNFPDSNTLVLSTDSGFSVTLNSV